MIENAVKLSADLLIKPFEGYHIKLPDGGCRAYADPGTGGRPWTIGWGSTGPDINENTIWTRQQADERIELDLMAFASGILSLSPEILAEPTKRFAALISFAYNCGLGNYRISTLRKRVNQKDWESASKEILKWNKAAGRVLPGLTRRRKAESLLLV